MKNLKHIFHSLAVIAAALLIFIPKSGYADEIEDIDLPCCRETECPTERISRGGEGVLQTADFLGLLVPVSGDRKELISLFYREDGYDAWQTKMITTRDDLERADKRSLMKAARTKPKIQATCTSTGTITTITPGGADANCANGDFIFADRDNICADPATGKHSLVRVTKTSKEEIERDVARLRGVVDASDKRISELDRKIADADARSADLAKRKDAIWEGFLERQGGAGTGSKTESLSYDVSLPGDDILFGSEAGIFTEYLVFPASGDFAQPVGFAGIGVW